jgi:CheY-like chemotaxis protein/chemotaxis signal transduction protein
MNQYLHLRCGPFQLLLDSRHVVEIAAAPAVPDLQGRRAWRGQSLPVQDLRTFLDVEADAAREQIVLRHADGTLSAIDVDRVQAVVERAPEDFSVIAPCSERLAGLVDGAWLDAGGGCLLRLRHPFAWAASPGRAADMNNGNGAVLRLLLVDDSPVQLGYLQELLAGSGCECLLARNGAEGVSAARRHRPDLILMDMEMPVLDGLAAARQLRADPALAATPIVMVTSHVEAEVMESAFTGGCNDYVVKPVHRDELLMKIAALTGRALPGLPS